ncbi:hypothetical protein MY11210_005912 [Beauveria gryllotalpidicola]
MLTLSLLLSAAAGVNAYLGGEVKSVSINETSFICADDCTFGGVYFAQPGHFCPDNEVIVTKDKEGTSNPNPFLNFDCIGMGKSNGLIERPRSSGEEPPECLLLEVTDDNQPGDCVSYRVPGAGTKTVQWSDVEKEIKSAAAPKSNECAKEGRKVFDECRENKSRSFDECHKKGADAIESCQGLQ